MGGVNRGSPLPEAFSFSSVLSSSHARSPRPRFSCALFVCITHLCRCTGSTSTSASSVTLVSTPVQCRK